MGRAVAFNPVGSDTEVTKSLRRPQVPSSFPVFDRLRECSRSAQRAFSDFHEIGPSIRFHLDKRGERFASGIYSILGDTPIARFKQREALRAAQRWAGRKGSNSLTPRS
jgi:hypothetical protein